MCTYARGIARRSWDDAMLDAAYATLVADLPLAPSAPGGMIRYRSSLTLSLFFKGYLAITEQLAQRLKAVAPLPAPLRSAATGFHSMPPKSSQYYFLVSTHRHHVQALEPPSRRSL